MKPACWREMSKAHFWIIEYLKTGETKQNGHNEGVGDGLLHHRWVGVGMGWGSPFTYKLL